MDTNKLFKVEENKVRKVQRANGEIGTLINDLCDYVLNEDYRRAASVAAYLLIALAKQASVKPFGLLRKANH